MPHQSVVDDDFRNEVRAFIRAKLPDDIAARARAGEPARRAEILRWTVILAARGWSTPTWPVEQGGAGWTASQRQIFDEEALLAGAPPLHIQSVFLAGPMILRFGTEAQKQAYLPAIREGRELWAQGFSEPGAGSDLAGLRTRAARRNNGFVINGQKIWTSDAYFCDQIFCLVRTDDQAPKHRGLSMLLFPLDLPGVTVRPIPMIDGGQSLCEVFFDDVFAPAEALLGEENRGWEYARFLLDNERATTAEVGRNRYELERLRSVIAGRRARGERIDGYQRKVAEHEVDLMALESANAAALATLEWSSDRPTPSVLKVQGTELLQSMLETSVRAAGPRALATPGDQSPDTPLGEDQHPGLAAEFLFRRAATIYGGSTEVQLKIIGRWLATADALLPHPTLSDDQVLIRDSVRQFLDGASAQARASSCASQDGRRFGELGWIGVDFPEQFGGLGCPPSDAAVIVTELARGLRAREFVQGRLSARVLAEAGASGDLLSSLLAGQERVAFAPLDGGDCRMTSGDQGANITVFGEKRGVLGLDDASAVLVAARDDQGRVGLAYVPVDAPGVAIRTYRMMDGQLAGDLVLKDSGLPAEAALSATTCAGAAIATACDRATIDVCAELVGLAEGALWLTRDYLLVREQFGRPLIQFQALEHRLAWMHIEVERARAALSLALEALDETDVCRRARGLSAASARAGLSAQFVTAQALQLHGGIAMTEAYPVGGYFKRVRVLSAIWGDPEEHIDRVAGGGR